METQTLPTLAAAAAAAVADEREGERDRQDPDAADTSAFTARQHLQHLQHLRHPYPAATTNTTTTASANITSRLSTDTAASINNSSTRFMSVNRSETGASGLVSSPIAALATSTFAANALQSLPNSQESRASGSSTVDPTIPRLLPSSSNVSQDTGPATQLTSPSSSVGRRSPLDASDELRSFSPSPSRQQIRPATPMDVCSSDGSHSARTSPNAKDAPYLTQAAKRTASGTVKPVSVAPMGIHTMSPSSEINPDSRDSNSTRIGQLAAELKTRLSYAMLKVQNGWETRSIEEIENMTSQSASPMITTPGRLTNSAVQSPRHHRPDVAARSATTEILEQVTSSPKRHAGLQGRSPLLDGPSRSVLQVATQPGHVSHRSLDQISSSLAPVEPVLGTSSGSNALAPAPEIVPGRNSRRTAAISQVPRLLSSSSAPLSGTHRTLNSTQQASPTTPVTTLAPPRPSILRMPSHQAEKDAVDTLLFMRSPHSSSHFPINGTASASSTAQPSPLRANFLASAAPVATKTVAFDLDNSTGSSSRSSRSPPDFSHVGDRGSGAAGLETARKVRKREEVHRMLRRVGAGTVDESDSDDDLPFQIPRREVVGK